jgi:hypothetical protein
MEGLHHVHLTYVLCEYFHDERTYHTVGKHKVFLLYVSAYDFLMYCSDENLCHMHYTQIVFHLYESSNVVLNMNFLKILDHIQE